MANNNPTSIYIELRKLLDEMCRFLSDERNIVPAVRAHASVLFERIKGQSKVLAQMKEFPLEGESYVEMKGQLTPANMYVEFENPKDEIYCDIAENASVEVNSPEALNSKEICPYMNRKYSDFTSFRKRGLLSKREKLLFFDTNRKYYGLVYENYFLLYLNETDGQATHALNLQDFHGSVVGENPKSFFLINKSTKTPYIFFAVSQKDKLQWLAAINNKTVLQSPNQLCRYSVNSANMSVNKKKSLTIRESKMNEDLYEMLEEDYDRVVNSHVKLSSGIIKTGNKPLPKIPNLPTPPLRPKKAIQPAPVIIRPTSSSDLEDDDDEETNKNQSEDDHYDTVCAPRLAPNRRTPSVRTRNANLASVHPSVVSDLNRRFNKSSDLSPLMKKSTPSPEPPNITTCSSAEYYDSVVGPPVIMSGSEEDTQLPEEDIYDSVVNVLSPQMMSFQPQTIDELKARFSKIHHDVIKPRDDDLQTPITKPEVKVEKTKSVLKKFYFLRSGSTTNII